MDTKSSKCVHLVEGGTIGSQDVNMAPMGKTSLGRVIRARRRQKTSFTNLETHGDGSGYLACDTCSSGVPNEIVPAEIVPIGNILVGNNIGFQTRTKGSRCLVWRWDLDFSILHVQNSGVTLSHMTHPQYHDNNPKTAEKTPTLRQNAHYPPPPRGKTPTPLSLP